MLKTTFLHKGTTPQLLSNSLSFSTRLPQETTQKYKRTSCCDKRRSASLIFWRKCLKFMNLSLPKNENLTQKQWNNRNCCLELFLFPFLFFRVNNKFRSFSKFYLSSREIFFSRTGALRKAASDINAHTQRCKFCKSATLGRNPRLLMAIASPALSANNDIWVF